MVNLFEAAAKAGAGCVSKLKWSFAKFVGGVILVLVCASIFIYLVVTGNIGISGIFGLFLSILGAGAGMLLSSQNTIALKPILYLKTCAQIETGITNQDLTEVVQAVDFVADTNLSNSDIVNNAISATGAASATGGCNCQGGCPTCGGDSKFIEMTKKLSNIKTMAVASKDKIRNLTSTGIDMVGNVDNMLGILDRHDVPNLIANDANSQNPTQNQQDAQTMKTIVEKIKTQTAPLKNSLEQVKPIVETVVAIGDILAH